MTSISEAAGTGTVTTAVCKRPGCGTPLPPGTGRGRHRVFCSDDCARRYHNDARLPAGNGTSTADPLTELENLLRQAAVAARTAREQAVSLDPARVRADIADAEAARCRAEAAAVTARARQGEAESEAQALAEALAAARDAQAAATGTARTAEDNAGALAAELDQLRRTADEKIAATARTAREQAADARDTRTAADAEISRARQAATDARAETQRARDDAARERDALRDSYNAQLDAQRALTGAERARAERAEAQLETERADRRQLTSHLTSNNDHEPPALPRGARSK